MRKSRKTKVKNDQLYLDACGDKTLPVGSQQWYAWLDSHKGFIFEGSNGHFTARREIRRGMPYWYGYRRRGGRLSKTYLGKSEDLTLERLEQASAALAGHTTLAQLSRKSNLADLIAALETPDSASQDTPEAYMPDRPFLSPAKTRPPALPQNLVARPRLTQRITTPVTLVYAPSGFGKSTLLNEWQQSCGIPVAWVSLDVEDNSPSVFWLMVVTVLQAIKPQLGQALLPYFTSLSPARLTEMVIGLASEITQALEQPDSSPALGLVLDDYQHIQSPEIHTSLQIFIEHLPSQMQIIVSTHTRPPLAVGYLRTTGRVSELTTDDLRFNLEEGIDFLSRYAEEYPLAYSDMQSLVKHTEGWPTGLMLATLALKQQNSKIQFPEAFTGAHSYLREYFMERVLYRQPPSVQQFLLKTAILRQLTGGLCDAVTQHDDGAEMLSRLWQENLFLVKLEEQGWYRYHDMFAEMLYSELEIQYPGEIQQLHRHAARWYQSQNAPADAVYHLLAIEAWKEASILIESVALHEMQYYGEDSRLLRWLQQLPETVVQQHKTLLSVYVRLARVSLSPSEVERFLGSVESNIASKPADQHARDEREVLDEIERLRHQWMTGDVAEDSPDLSGGYDDVWQMLNGIIRYQYQYRRNLDKSVELEYEVYENAKRLGNLYVMLMAGGGCAIRILSQGNLRRSEKLAYEVLQRAYVQRGRLPQPASIALMALSRICYERNQLEESHQLLVRASEVDPNPTSTNMPLNIAIQRALIQSTQGDHNAALTTIQAARELNIKRPSRIWLDQDLIGYQALLHVRQGDFTKAERLVEEADTHETHGLIMRVRAEILLAQHQAAAAETYLSQLLDQYPYGFFHEPLMGARVLLAIALFEQHKLHQARRVMATAVRLAGPEAHIRPFLDYAPQCLSLLKLVLDTEKLTTGTQVFIRRILRVRKQHPEIHDAVDDSESLPLSMAASISEREQEVLRLVGAGMSNRDIAGKLSIAESTVKSHLKNIYAKLDVHNRTQAVAYAQALKLVYFDL